MFDPSSDPGPLTPAERWIGGGFLAVVLGLFTLEVCLDYEPVKLTALLIVLFWVPLLVLHEAGHAVVAALLGWHVARVVIGFGREVCRFRIGETLVEVRLVPLEGFVQPVPTNLRYPRLKSALIYLAGPGVELVLLGLVVLLLGPRELLNRSDMVGLLIAQSLAVAVLIGVFFNLVPHQVYTRNGPIDNDGLGAIRSFLIPESDYARRIGLRYDEVEAAWQEPEPANGWHDSEHSG